MKRKLSLILLLLLLLVLTGSALALADSYHLDWITPLDTNGGGPSASTHYKVNFTLGQTVTGESASPEYQAELGYWYGVGAQERVFLSIIKR